MKALLPSFFLLARLLLPELSWAARTAPPATVWDQIFASQAAKFMREGMERLAEGDYDRAVRVLARAAVTAPQEPLAHVLLGSAYYWEGQVGQAMQEYQAALKLDPENAQARQLLGIAFAWKGDIQAAAREFREAARLDPDRPDVQMNLGSVEQSQGRLSEALDRFRAAVRLDPGFPLYHYQLGMLYLRLGREADAQDELEAALRLFPAYQDALLELGALRERRGDLPGALSRYREAARLKPRDAVARFRLAEALLRHGEPDQARKALADSLGVSPTSREGGRLALSVAYGGPGAPTPGAEAEGSKPEAPSAGAGPAEPADPVGLFEKNLRRLPPGVEAKAEILAAYAPPPRLAPRLPADSRNLLGQALENRLGGNPGGQPGPILAKREVILSADAAARKRQIDSLMKDLRSAMGSLPPGGKVHFGLNVQYQEPKDGGQGPSLHYEPRSVGNDLGLWVVGTGWMSLIAEVLPDLEQTARDHPAVPAFLAAGLGELAMGESAASREAFSRAERLAPQDPLAYLGLAAAAVEAGDEKSAAQNYRLALSLDPGNRTAQDALEWLRR